MGYYIALPDLNSEPNTEVDKCETQLGIFRGTAPTITVKTNLSCKIHKTMSFMSLAMRTVFCCFVIFTFQ